MSRRMNEKLFYELKGAIKRGGASAEEISKVFGISISTYYRVHGKNTWEDYKKEKDRRISRMMEKRETNTITFKADEIELKGEELTYYQQKMLGMIREQNKMLMSLIEMLK